MPARFVLKVGRGVVDHFPIRVPEWIMTVAVLGFGSILYSIEDTFSRTPSFATLALWFDQHTWAVICFNIGLWRLFALVVNGTFKTYFPYSAHLRGITALVACALWGQIVLGILIAYKTAGGSPTGILAYGIFMLFDVWNMMRSWFDIGVQKAAAREL